MDNHYVNYAASEKKLFAFAGHFLPKKNPKSAFWQTSDTKKKCLALIVLIYITCLIEHCHTTAFLDSRAVNNFKNNQVGKHGRLYLLTLEGTIPTEIRI